MNANVALLLVQDGLTSGFIYALLTLTILLVFLVTRVLWIPAGDFLVMGAVSLAMLRQGLAPGTIWIALLLGGLAGAAEIVRACVARQWRGVLRPVLACLVPPLVIAPLILWAAPHHPPLFVQIALVLALITPMGFSTYRLAFRPLADRSVLLLLFMAVAVHYALVGFAQIAFGSESFRTPPFLPGRLDVHVTRLSYQFLLIVAVSSVLSIGLFLFTRFALWGQALRATAINRLGATLVGVPTEAAGAIAFSLAAGIGALSGVLIGPVTALYYDSGFTIGVKGFVGTVIGGMVSFPLALLGALAVGLIESFAAFYASAYKDVLVYLLLVPFLLWRSATARAPEEFEL